MNFSNEASAFSPKPEILFNSDKKLYPLQLEGMRVPMKIYEDIEAIESAIAIADYAWNYFEGDVSRIQEMSDALEDVTMKIAEANIETSSDFFESTVMKMIPRNRLNNKLNYMASIHATGLVQVPGYVSGLYLDPLVSLTENINNHIKDRGVLEETRELVEKFSKMVCSNNLPILEIYQQELLLNLIRTNFGQLDILFYRDIQKLEGLDGVGGEVINYLVGRQVASKMNIFFDFDDRRSGCADGVLTQFVTDSIVNRIVGRTNTDKLLELLQMINQTSDGFERKNNISTNPLD